MRDVSSIRTGTISTAGTQQAALSALNELSAALEHAQASAQNCHMLTYQRRNELMHRSVALKHTISSSDECIYDLASLLDLLTLAAFGSVQRRDHDALELIARSISVLQRSLAGNAEAVNECGELTEEVWTWLGNSDGLASKW